ETTLPANVVADLLAAVNGNDEDMASFIAVGSQWRDWLVGPDGKAQTLTETIKRLAGDAAPDARQALTWLVGKLVHMAQPPDTEQFNALTRAYAYLPSSEERVPAALAPILPADYDFTDVGYLARGSEACKAVVTVQGPAKKGDAPFYGGSGWLLTPDLVVVPAHLIQGPNDVKDENAAA